MRKLDCTGEKMCYVQKVTSKHADYYSFREGDSYVSRNLCCYIHFPEANPNKVILVFLKGIWRTGQLCNGFLSNASQNDLPDSDQWHNDIRNLGYRAQYLAKTVSKCADITTDRLYGIENIEGEPCRSNLTHEQGSWRQLEDLLNLSSNLTVSKDSDYLLVLAENYCSE